MWKIYPLDLGTFKIDKSVLTYLEGMGEITTCPCISFLIKGYKNILIDTGFTDLDKARLVNSSIARSDSQDLFKNLENLSLSPADIDIIIFTHLHFDHFADFKAFRNTKKIVQKRELEFSEKPVPFQFDMYYPLRNKNISYSKVNFDVIDGDKKIFDGIKIITTPGHTPGSQSVLVEKNDGVYCIAGDIACVGDNFRKMIPPGIHTDVYECYDSLKKIKNNSDFIIPSHDRSVIKKGRVY